jgi:antitoxin ParD1/3/4
MRPAEKLSITLPAEMARMVRDKVEGGAYASNSEVIREALRTWQEREAMKAQRLDEIRARIAESIDDPRPSLADKAVNKRLKKLHQRTVSSSTGHGRRKTLRLFTDLSHRTARRGHSALSSASKDAAICFAIRRSKVGHVPTSGPICGSCLTGGASLSPTKSPRIPWKLSEYFTAGRITKRSWVAKEKRSSGLAVILPTGPAYGPMTGSTPNPKSSFVGREPGFRVPAFGRPRNDPR